MCLNVNSMFHNCSKTSVLKKFACRICEKSKIMFEGRIANMANDDRRARIMLTVPVISHVITVTMISDIVDITRFATAEKLV